MKKLILNIAALCMAFCFIFAECNAADIGDGERYAERLAEAGYAAYVFDFCGGSVGGNKSDGSNREMSVPISWSEEAKEIIPDCEFFVIKNGGHEFFGQPFEDAMSYILPYLDMQLNNEAAESEATETMQMKIGDTGVTVNWEENESVEALKELCQNGPLTIQMSMYGGFEQVGSVGQSLPRNDSQTTTQAGDIVLYSGDQIVVFYGSNSWAYTRLGRITDRSAQEMAELLGNGDVMITIEQERHSQ